MNRYEKCKIYKIDVGYNKCYIGSTCEELSQRMARHRSKYTQYLKGKTYRNTVFTIFDEFDVENCKIEWIEDYPCNSKKELEAREGYYTNKNKCVNKREEGRSKTEWYQDNRGTKIKKSNDYFYNHREYCNTMRKAYHQECRDNDIETCNKYYQQNKDRLNQIKREIVICQSGSKVSKTHLRRHEKTEKHHQWLQQQPEQEPEEKIKYIL